MKFILVILVCSFSLVSNAKIVLPEIFSDYMVLQQNSTVKIWGKAKPNKKIKLITTWDNGEYSVITKDDGSWILSLKTSKASFTEHSITISGDKSLITISNILIGEVWFCSGQSNMEMTFKGYPNQPVENADKIIKEANPELGVRMVKIKKNGLEQPSKFAEGKWMNCTNDNVPNFSAVAYFFGLKLRNELNVPIGLINSSWGGSSIEGWMSRELVEKYSDFNFTKILSESETWKKPWVMYNGMVSPLKDYIIKGFIWYQGESNVGRHTTYASKLKDMVELWRHDWNLGELPFYLVELAPYLYGDSIAGAKLREAQFHATKNIANSDIVSTSDLVDMDEQKIIHPKRKQQVGERLGNLALKQAYNRDSICSKFPIYKSFEISNNIMKLNLSNQHIEPHTVDFSSLKKDSLIGFEIAGEDHVFYPANAKFIRKNGTHEIESYDIIVQSDKVEKPIAVRYLFKSFSRGNVFNSCKLPLLPFRTDDWDN